MKKNVLIVLLSTVLVLFTACKNPSNNNSSNNSTINNSQESSISESSNTNSSVGTSNKETSNTSSKPTLNNSSNQSSSKPSNPSYSWDESLDPYNGTYYNSITNDLVGDDLITALSKVIYTSNGVSYSGLWDAYKTTDIKPGTNYIWDMYSNENYVVGGSKQGANYSKEGDSYNREHSIPQSWFSEKSPMKSDLFHVYPTDGYVNNRRSNYPFGEVSSSTYKSKNGSKLGKCINSSIGTVFEPIDEYKGDFARTYFYMLTRYKSQIGSWGGGVFKGSFPYLNTYFLDTYIKWAIEDPVSEKEIARNEAVYKIQKNRNPFIDHPSYLFRAFDDNYIANGQITNKQKADKVIELIDAIGEVSLSSETTITNVRNQYNILSTEAKKLVTNYQTLLDAEDKLNDLKDRQIALDFDKKVDTIGEVTLEKQALIESIRLEYNNLTQNQKSYITKLNILEEKEADFNKIYGEYLINDCIKRITIIGEVTLDKAQLVYDARSAYDNLNEILKNQIPSETLNILIEAETKLEGIKEELKGQVGDTKTIVFTSQNFANSLDYSFSSSVEGDGYDATRGIQFLRSSSLTISTSSYKEGICKISISVSSNSDSFTLAIKVGEHDLSSENNQLDKSTNKVFEFYTTNNEVVSGNIQIIVTNLSTSPNKSFYIKSIIIN
ncbi:MAG: endonuclease [Bacillales bacterium]|nr:endonuclease [Bacillales bacterium]